MTDVEVVALDASTGERRWQHAAIANGASRTVGTGEGVVVVRQSEEDPFDEPSNRTRAVNVGGTSTTRSPDAINCWASNRPRPAADSIAHTRSVLSGSAHANRRWSDTDPQAT